VAAEPKVRLPRITLCLGNWYHCDYAGNGGSNVSSYRTNGTARAAGGQSDPNPTGVIVLNVAADTYVNNNPGFASSVPPKPIPVTMQNIATIQAITDGTSNTLLVGEKFISIKYYQAGNTGTGYPTQWGDLNGYTAGVGWDQVRYGFFARGYREFSFSRSGTQAAVEMRPK
jgi:hypothetical protein